MEITYVDSTSTVKPSEVDTTSSSTIVYLHKDIVQDETTKIWNYKEARLTPEEYQRYAQEQSAERLKQIVSGTTSGSDNQMIIMEALADLYNLISTKTTS